MSGPKVFIALLFLIALLFVISINLGAMHQDDSTFQAPNWAKILVFSQALKIGDLQSTTAACQQQESIVVPIGSTCLFTIQQSSFLSRTIELQLVQGTSALVKLTQEKTLPTQQSLTQTGAVTDREQMKIYPGKAQGMLAITCQSGEAASCILKLK